MAEINQHTLTHKFKTFTLDECFLHPEQVDIWQFPLRKSWPSTANILSIDEQQRTERFYFERHRRRYSCAHNTLRCILARYLPKTTAKALEFTENKYGKPSLKHNPEGLKFNLSHSGEYALLAVGQEHELGVDLEVLSAREFLSLGDYMFSELEREALHGVTKALRAVTFFNIWSQKEAFIKACGMGLSYPTQDFSVPHISANQVLIPDNKFAQTWQMTSFRPNINSCAAICTKPQVQTIRYKFLENAYDVR